MRMQTGIQPFNEKEADNLSSCKGFVSGKDITFGEFIEHSIKNKDKITRFYFGKLSQELADRIEAETGRNVENYNVVINSSEVRHILSKHGDSAREAFKGQLGIDKLLLVRLPEVFDCPEEVEKLKSLDYGRRVAFALRKKINGYAIVVSGMSDGRAAIQIDSFWVRSSE